MSRSSTIANNEQQIPSNDALVKVFKQSLKLDKPIKTDYWISSITKEACIGINFDKELEPKNGKKDYEKILYKNTDEFTSPIVSVCKLDETSALAETSNTLYIISVSIDKKKITNKDIQEDEDEDDDE